MKDKFCLREKLFRAGITLLVVTIMSVSMLKRPTRAGNRDDP